MKKRLIAALVLTALAGWSMPGALAASSSSIAEKSGQQAAASEHEIGAIVFGTRVSGAIWSNHADRSELRRLLRAGRSFVSGRYRELLQARRLR